MRFLRWLEKQQGRSDPIGDLARDTFKWDAPTTDHRRFRDFWQYMLVACDYPCRGAKAAAVEAWREYYAAHPNKKNRTAISPKLRFAVLARDGFRCRTCGRSADQGAVLEVDHKMPIARGGTNLPSNLWTLCFVCNSGKSSTVLRSQVDDPT